jgi:hypothetical protein
MSLFSEWFRVNGVSLDSEFQGDSKYINIMWLWELQLPKLAWFHTVGTFYQKKVTMEPDLKTIYLLKSCDLLLWLARKTQNTRKKLNLFKWLEPNIIFPNWEMSTNILLNIIYRFDIYSIYRYPISYKIVCFCHSSSIIPLEYDWNR